jgi:hypothetical protein
MPQHEQTTITVTITGTEEGDVEEALKLLGSGGVDPKQVQLRIEVEDEQTIGETIAFFDATLGMRPDTCDVSYSLKSKYSAERRAAAPALNPMERTLEVDFRKRREASQ